MLSGFEKIALAVLVIVLMTGMGASLTPEAFKRVAQRPKGVLIGVLSQFGWMPLIAFGLATLLKLDPMTTIGLLIIGSTPGGTTSNLFTYVARADLALSISMTAVSTLVAVLLMPVVLALYVGVTTDNVLTIPYGSIVSTLAVVLVPVLIGMQVRRRNVALAARIERAGSLAGAGVLVLLIVSGIARNGEMLLALPGSTLLAAAGLSIIGLLLGYGSATLVGLDRPSRRAVGLETGIQNSPLALGIIVASFPDSTHPALMTPVLVYALFVLLIAAGVSAAWRRTAVDATTLEP